MSGVARVAVTLAVLALLAMPARAQNRWPSESAPRPLPARAVKFPPYEVRTLDNGLRVVAILHHEQPVVSMRMIVRAGTSLDPRGKAGLADLAASLLDQGTTGRSASEVHDAIDFIGGAMGAGAGTDLTYMNVVVMKDSFEVGLRMLSDVARDPAFAPEEIERKRRQTLSALQVSLEDPSFVADAVFDRLVYGFHPYGLPQSRTPETLAAITRDDLLAYHARHFVPNNAILAIVGDVTADEAFDHARKVFGDWQRREVTRQPFVAPPDPTKRVIVVNKPDAVQTEVRVGHVGIRRGDPDYMPLNLAIRILGGEGANRLHQVLRTERGLTYGAKADMRTLLEGGDFEASTNTRSGATGEVLRMIVDEFWRLQRERVGERELSAAKAYLTGSFPLTIETPDAIATQVLNVLFYGLPVEQLQSFRERVNAVRADDIERVARFYLKPDRLSVVLVGNATAFTSQLRGLGFGNFEVIEMADLDLTAANFKRSPANSGTGRSGGADKTPRGGGRGGARYVPAASGALRPLAYRASNAQSTRGGIVAPGGPSAHALVTKVITAKGGLETLRSIKTITVATRARGLGVNSRQGTLESTTYLEYPNRVRVESREGGGDMTQAYDGTKAWVKTPDGTHDVPDERVRELQANLRRDMVAALLAAHDMQVRARLLPDSRDESGKLRHAIELSSQTLDPMVLYIDPETHLVVKQTYVTGGVGRPLVEELFGDYRPVDGVQVAFMTTVRVRGEPVLERRITKFVINTPFSATFFSRPAS
jgi:zinc protease